MRTFLDYLTAAITMVALFLLFAGAMLVVRNVWLAFAPGTSSEVAPDFDERAFLRNPKNAAWVERTRRWVEQGPPPQDDHLGIDWAEAVPAGFSRLDAGLYPQAGPDGQPWPKPTPGGPAAVSGPYRPPTPGGPDR